MRYYFYILFLFLLPTTLSAQCDYTISASVVANSTCARNGIIQVTLSGSDLGNFDLQQAQYYLKHATHSTPPTANHGLIENVPPGTYTVMVKAMCYIGNNWIEKELPTKVTVTGNYMPPNPVRVNSNDVIKSYKCDSSGIMPVNVSGGLPPYVLTVSSGSFVSAVVIPTEGLFNVTNLPTGNYTLELKDACGYFPSTTIQNLGVVEERFLIGAITSTSICEKKGVIPVIIQNGKPPFMIEISDGTTIDTINVPAVGTHNISDLSVGNYTIKVSDACNKSATFNKEVVELKGKSTQSNLANSAACGPGTGRVQLNFTGVSPFSITAFKNSAFWKNEVETGNSKLFTGLDAGVYLFQVIDSCGNTDTVNVTIKTVDFKVNQNVTVTSPVGCDGKGTATIKVLTGKSPYSITDIKYSSTGNTGTCANTVWAFPMPITTNYNLTDLCVGDYKVYVADSCGGVDSVSFKIQPKPLNISVKNLVSTLDCAALGEVLIEVSGGKPKYELFYTKHPTDAVPSPAGEILTASGTLHLTGLPKGNYQIAVNDQSCLVDTVSFRIDSVKIEGDLDFFEEFFYPPDTLDAYCQKLKVKMTGDSYRTYKKMIEDSLLIVKFIVVDPATSTKIDSTGFIRILDQFVTFSLPSPYTYKTMRDNGYVVNAVIGSDIHPDCLELVFDTLRFAEVKSTIKKLSPGCDGFKVSIEQSKGINGVFCYPYNVRIDTNPAWDTTINDQKAFTKLLNFGEYELTFTDREGYIWTDSVKYTDWRNPGNANSNKVVDRECDSYKYQFFWKNICYPYTWDLLDSNNTLVYSDIVASDVLQKTGVLDYGEVYKLRVISLQNDTTYINNITESNTYDLVNYRIDSTFLSCIPNLGKGNIRIYRNASAPRFVKGTKINYISGPTVPVHPTIVAIGNETNFYPFSVNSSTAEESNIAEGLYKFEVIDTCGFVVPLQVNFKHYKVLDFDFDMVNSCSSATIKPKATVVLGADTISNIHFRFYSNPGPPKGSVSIGGAIQIDEDGEYKMLVALNPLSNSSCPMDTLKFSYSKQTAKVSFDKVKAYLCESGGGYIDFLVKGGIGDIRYSLLDPTSPTPLIPVKDTILPKGEAFKVYNFGQLGVSYEIQFRDVMCAGAGGTEIITLDNMMNDRLIYGPERLCMGDTIKLYSDAPATTFNWTGPNGFASTDLNPIIPNATSLNNGEYKLVVTNIVGCTGNLKRDLKIDIAEPKTPKAEPLTVFCLDNTTETLIAIADSGYNVNWFDGNKIPMVSAPIIPLSAVDTLTYYVSQTEESLGCLSDTIPVSAQISDLPRTNTLAFSLEMCAGANAAIYIPDVTAGLIYEVYNTGGVLVARDTAITSDTLRLTSNETLSDSTIYSLNVVNEFGCYSAPHPFKVNVIDTAAKLMAGPGKICLFDRLNLTSTDLGDSAVYTWTGPNSWTSHERNPFIDSAKVEDSGNYNLEVQLYGCMLPISKTVGVDVLYPKAPVVANPFIFCQFDTIDQGLQINIPADHTVQWYDSDKNAISAPIPSTAIGDTINYFVTHIYDLPACEGASTEVEVIVSPLPTSEVSPFSPEMCTDAFPKIYIPDVKTDYTYNIYNSLGVKVANTVSINADTILLIGSEKLYDSTIYTVQVLNEHRCSSPYNKTFPVNTIDPAGNLIVGPDKICLFETLNLTSISFGDSVEYNWSGPNNWTSHDQNPFIDSALVSHSGDYTLLVNLYGCNSPIEKTVPVDVLYPKAPVVANPFIFCQFDTINQGLQINVPADHTVQWYDSDKNAIAAPIPSTAVGDTINYFVTHIYDLPACEGASSEVEVIVSPLPTSEVNPFSPEMCTDAFPKIYIPNVKTDFTYNIYNSQGVIIANTTSINADTILLLGSEKLYDSTIYTVQVLNEHRCSSPYNKTFPINTIDPSGSLIAGPDKICIFETINLTSTSFGDSVTYNWSGPDNWTSHQQNPTIDSALVKHSGDYTLLVNLYGCNRPIEKVVEVNVLYPDAPIVAEPFIFCESESVTRPLNVTAEANHTLQWYSVHGYPIIAPIPPTNIPDTLQYFVAQIYNQPACLGERTPVQVIISPLPDFNLSAHAPDICPGIFPSIYVPDAKVDYTYNLYNKNGELVLTEVSTIADTLKIFGPNRLYSPTSFYIDVSNEHNCLSTDRQSLNVSIVDYLEMGPEKIPQYKRDKRYSFQLTTNAHEPYVFRTEDILPATLQLSSEGEIYGTPPRNGHIDPGTFTVEVEDADGCLAKRTYHLESDFFVPQIITPNGDGYNDHFMLGYKLIIFDRLGIKLFEGDNGWDGTYNGQPVAPDTYFYVLYYPDKNGKEKRKEGYVTVLKR